MLHYVIWLILATYSGQAWLGINDQGNFTSINVFMTLFFKYMLVHLLSKLSINSTGYHVLCAVCAKCPTILLVPACLRTIAIVINYPVLSHRKFGPKIFFLLVLGDHNWDLCNDEKHISTLVLTNLLINKVTINIGCMYNLYNNVSPPKSNRTQWSTQFLLSFISGICNMSLCIKDLPLIYP